MPSLQGLLESDADEAIGARQEPIGGQRWAQDVLEEGFAAALVEGSRAGGGVQAEAGFAHGEGMDSPIIGLRLALRRERSRRSPSLRRSAEIRLEPLGPEATLHLFRCDGCARPTRPRVSVVCQTWV